MFKYSLDNKRYHTFNYFLKNKFGQKTIKIPLDLGLTCPNYKTGGCIYCSNNSVSNITQKNVDIIKQFNDTKYFMDKKWPNSLYIAYFQAGTNTNTSVVFLKNNIDLLLKEKNVVGISIATRPDSITDDMYDYLDELNKKTFLTIEIGLQSANEKTLQYINRGHNLDVFTKCIKKLKSLNIFTVVHIINGLPYETKKDMINTVNYINNLGIDGIKIHALYISKDTRLEKLYKIEKFKLLNKDEYIDIVCSQLQVLNPEVVVERITGDPTTDELIAPMWLLKKVQLINDIDKEMVKRNIYQGDKIIDN